MKRRALLAASMLLSATKTYAQDKYPSKTIRIIVPLAAGGIYDTLARLVGEDIAKQFNVPVVVENKPGGNYVIGMRALATAKPDGYTIGISSGSILSQTPIIFPQVGFALEDFEAVAPLVISRNVLIVSGSSPIRDLATFVQLGRASKRPIQLATTGIGSVSHLAVLQLGKLGNFQVEAIPHKSNPEALQAVVGGHIPAATMLLASVLEQHRAGRIRILAYSGKERHPSIPEVPTYAEAGYADLTSETWSAIFSPAGTPSDIVSRLHQAIAAALPRLRQKLPVDTEIYSTTPSGLHDLASKDREYWRDFFSDPEILKKARSA